MKILKSTLFKKRKCEFGDFELVPERGWKISHTFFDYESRLRVVTESDTNEDHWRNPGAGIRVIPTRQFIVDPKNGIILAPADWIKYFSYQPSECVSDDGKYRLITTRVHEPEGHTDSLRQELIDLASGKIISTSNGVAFNDSKRKKLLDDHYENIEGQKKHRGNLALGVYPAGLQQQHIAGLLPNEIIAELYDDKLVYRLTFDSNRYLFGQGNRPATVEEWENYSITVTHEHTSLSEFWNSLTKQKDWLANFKPRQIHKALHDDVITFYNNLVSTNELTYQQHAHLREWMNMCWDDTLDRNVYWQFCSNCKRRVLYYPRYPRHACNNCVDLIMDEDGHRLDYGDIHELKFEGDHFKLYSKKTNKVVKIFIGPNEYWAEEARFGGIVHQKR